MSLRLQINLIVATIILLMVGSMIALELDAVRRSVREEILATHRVTAQMLNRVAIEYGMDDSAQLVRFLRQLGRVRANNITLSDGAGRVLYRSPPSTYKKGREAPGWFSALVLPAASEQSLVLPGGLLRIEAEPSRAVLDGWDDMATLAGLGAAALLVINALVFWAAGRAVRPFSTIVGALNRLQAGDFDVALPPLRGKEAGAIGAAFNRMVAVLAETMQSRQRAFEAERRLSDSRELAGLIEGHIDAERREIARTLHDELGQSVTAIRSLAVAIVASGCEQAPAAQLISEEAARLYDQMHGMIPRLAPMTFNELGLRDALGELLQRMRVSHPGTHLGLDARDIPESLDGATALAAYRIVQEGLTNALRHADAGAVHVRIGAQGASLHVQVTDDGKGIGEDWRARGHFGLRWLSERAQALGGSLAITMLPHGGTELRAALPLGA